MHLRTAVKLQLAAAALAAAAAAPASAVILQVPRAGTTVPISGAAGPEAPQFPELGGTLADGSVAGLAGTSRLGVVNRTIARTRGARGASAPAASVTKSQPSLDLSFHGIDHRQQRLASGGNQFSLEPPDQGLCAGNGYVLETVNSALRVYDRSGSPVGGVVALNAFYGYPPSIDRATGVRGPFITDPSCLFDADTQRWFHVVLTLDSAPSGAFTGTSHLDLAVSQTANPFGGWNVYRIPTQNDGTAGTPNHQCPGGPCFGDYPHLGADANGIFLTTNEFPLFADGYTGVNAYAISKRALAAGGPTVPVVLLDGPLLSAANAAFTVWPAISPPGQASPDAGGTEWLLSSDAVFFDSGTSSRLLLWRLSNTSSLDSAAPALGLDVRAVPVLGYAVPPPAAQKAGDFPLGQCLNVNACARILLGGPDRFRPEALAPLDTNDSRMQQVFYANGKLWAALDSTVNVGGADQAGVAWFVLAPSTGAVVRQGLLGVAGNDLAYPAVAVTSSGRGVIAFTIAGSDHYPSAAYASIDALAGVGPVAIAAEGAGPEDGFAGYRAFGDPPRPRWGDYGAAAVDGASIWIASEYVGQACTLAQYQAAPFGSCGGTRTALANWGTRVSRVTP